MASKKVTKKATKASPNGKSGLTKDGAVQTVPVPKNFFAKGRNAAPAKVKKVRGEKVEVKVRAVREGQYNSSIVAPGKKFMYSGHLNKDGTLPSWVETVDEKDAHLNYRFADEFEDEEYEDVDADLSSII